MRTMVRVLNQSIRYQYSSPINIKDKLRKQNKTKQLLSFFMHLYNLIHTHYPSISLSARPPSRPSIRPPPPVRPSAHPFVRPSARPPGIHQSQFLTLFKRGANTY